MRRFSIVALLVLVNCSLLTDGNQLPSDAKLANHAGDCWTAEIYTCNDYKNARTTITKRGYDYKLTRGYHAVIEKVGMEVERLKAKYGDVDSGLIALGCYDQAPGPFPAVSRSGDSVRDYWCARKAGERFESGLYRQ